MKYVIIGGGPTGLSLAWVLAQNNVEVTLLEKTQMLGGSWKNHWIDNKYFSENSPRVLSGSGYCRSFLQDIGMSKNDFANIYGDLLQSNMKVFSFLRKFLVLKDFADMAFMASIGHRVYPDDAVLQDWFDKSALSDRAKYALRIVSITICDTPENTNLHDFFGSFGLITLQQMKDSNKWHTIVKNKLEKLSHVKIMTNTKVTSLSLQNDTVSSVQCETHKRDSITIHGDRFILATQSNAICEILSSSKSELLENNWLPKQEFRDWCSDTHYNGFGFQLHFQEKIPMPNQWCWSCLTDWSIITLPISNWTTEFSKDPLVKTVWSCCIIDLDAVSNNTGRSANMSSKDEVVSEAVRQLMENYSFPTPYHITTSEGLYRKNGKWLSEMTGFTRKDKQYLPMKGNTDNLFALGCFTPPTHPSIAYMETAVQSSVKFLRHYHPSFKGFQNNDFSSFFENVVKISIILILMKKCS